MAPSTLQACAKAHISASKKHGFTAQNTENARFIDPPAHREMPLPSPKPLKIKSMGFEEAPS
jgi:hypothetical protein